MSRPTFLGTEVVSVRVLVRSCVPVSQSSMVTRDESVARLRGDPTEGYSECSTQHHRCKVAQSGTAILYSVQGLCPLVEVVENEKLAQPTAGPRGGREKSTLVLITTTHYLSPVPVTPTPTTLPCSGGPCWAQWSTDVQRRTISRPAQHWYVECHLRNFRLSRPVLCGSGLLPHLPNRELRRWRERESDGAGIGLSLPRTPKRDPRRSCVL